MLARELGAAVGDQRPAAAVIRIGADEYGNIKHEVQPGQTIGHILLIYGYTWGPISVSAGDQRHELKPTD